MWGLTLLPVYFVPVFPGLQHGFLRRIGLGQNVAGRASGVKVLDGKTGWNGEYRRAFSAEANRYPAGSRKLSI